jgi:hypothetical protein
MFKTFLIVFLIYILFKFIFDLIIPAAKVAGQVKKQMNAMQERMEGYEEHQRSRTQAASTPKEEKKEVAGEYIDFEEVSSK